ncbi:MAG: hypothetical protein R3Y58_01175 [Eubacteriales bacterium]
MIAIALGILQVLGIVLLAILGIVILLVVIILFAPISYRITGEGKSQIESITANGKARWLFGILRIAVKYTQMKIDWDAYFLWVQLNPEKRLLKKKQKIKKKRKIKTEPTQSKDETIEARCIESKEDNKEKITKEKIKKDKTQKDKTQKKKRKKINLKHKIHQICDTIKMLIEKKDKVVAFYYVDEHQYTIEKCKRLLRYLFLKIRPKLFAVCARLGFEDPSITGKVLAVLGVLYPLYAEHMQVIPDFEQVVYEGEIEVKGKIRIYPFVVVAMKLFMDKKVKETYSHIKSFEL